MTQGVEALSNRSRQAALRVSIVERAPLPGASPKDRSMKLALVSLSLLLAAPAFAKHHKKSSYHCVSDSGEISGVTSSKACKKAGGKWVKKTANDM
jgi:hypothetical protein